MAPQTEVESRAKPLIPSLKNTVKHPEAVAGPEHIVGSYCQVDADYSHTECCKVDAGTNRGSIIFAPGADNCPEFEISYVR